MLSPTIRAVLVTVPILAGLWWVDDTISRSRTIGWERNTVLKSAKKRAVKPDARVAVLGMSTSRDWIPFSWLARGLGVAEDDILSAQIGGCHQGCSYAEVRQLIAKGRRFETVFYGTNLFQMCEFPHSKRVLQQRMMIPLADIPRLFGYYLYAEDPLLYIGRFLGMSISGAYGDTLAVRRRIEKLAYRGESRGARAKRRSNAWRWARRKPIKRTKQDSTCTYDDDEIAYKLALTEGLLDDLTGISDRVYWMLLPDRTLSRDEPSYRKRWEKHIATVRRLADARPDVFLVDLVTDGARTRNKFRDGIHLNARGMREQRVLFERRMTELGAWSAPK